MKTTKLLLVLAVVAAVAVALYLLNRPKKRALAYALTAGTDFGTPYGPGGKYDMSF
jgi:hypothetical protein